MAEHPNLPSLIRLIQICGFETRRNDVVYCSPQTSVNTPNVVVFFGGDVQDFTENMTSHRDNNRYVKWNLENTAKLLQEKFADCHIVVVRPARMDYGTFSCFENFVPCAKCGVPEHSATYNTLKHLEELLRSLSQKLRTIGDEEMNEGMELSKKALISDKFSGSSKTSSSISWNPTFGRNQIYLENCDIKLIGFSKGCVVLNQFLYEFHHQKTSPSDDSNSKMISKIKEMYWLDGGHAGGKNTWITSKPLLETLSNLRISIRVHVTPYQIRDDHRPWIRKEERLFCETLRRIGAPIQRKVHFENVSRSLETHFGILEVFKEGDDSECSK